MSEQLEQVFVSLVDDSWKIYNEKIQNTYIDDILIGAVIYTNVESGYSLIDLQSTGGYHYLRFENLSNKQRIIFRLTNWSEDLMTAKVLGRKAQVVIGYGQQVSNIGPLWQLLKAEIKSSFIIDNDEPGIITCDADMASGYVYAQVPLIFDLDRYFVAKNQVNYELLLTHINATLHSLSKYLQGRLHQ